MIAVPVWVLAIAVLGLALIAVLIAAVLRRRKQTGIEEALTEISLDSLRDVVIADGMDGEIHLEVLVLTAQGLLVLDIKDVRGSVFVGERLNDWKVIDGIQRYSFPNPLNALAERVAAVRHNAVDMPCEGIVLFGPNAAISGTPPPGVCLPDDLVERFPKPGERERRQLSEAYAPHWSRLRSLCRRP